MLTDRPVENADIYCLCAELSFIILIITAVCWRFVQFVQRLLCFLVKRKIQNLKKHILKHKYLILNISVTVQKHLPAAKCLHPKKRRTHEQISLLFLEREPFSHDSERYYKTTMIPNEGRD